MVKSRSVVAKIARPLEALRKDIAKTLDVPMTKADLDIVKAYKGRRMKEIKW